MIKMGNIVIKENYLKELHEKILKAGGVKEVTVNGKPLLRAKDLPKHLTEKPKSGNELRHRMITEELTNLYLKKNHDYGNSFDISLDEDGLLVAKIRLGDKYQRFGSLLKKKQEVEDESRRDTLIDMANYAIMTVMWMDHKAAGKEPNADVDQWYKESKQRGKKDYNDAMDAIKHTIGGCYSHIPSGADLDGDTLRVFTDEEMESMLKNSIVVSPLELEAKKAGLK